LLDREELYAPKSIDNSSFIQGWVTDQLTSSPISNVKVVLQVGEKITYTDRNGYFKISIAELVQEHKEFKSDIIFSKDGFKNFNYRQAYLWNSQFGFPIQLERGVGFVEQNHPHKLLNDLPLNKNVLPGQNADPALQNLPGGGSGGATLPTVTGCTVPSSIRVGTSCSCASCGNVTTMSLDNYAGSGLDDEWISSWGTASLQAGAIAYRNLWRLLCGSFSQYRKWNSV
jgi:hypothetical protein